jgi:hypothetical protein
LINKTFSQLNAERAARRAELDWYHYDNRNNPNQNYDADPEHFEKWKKATSSKLQAASALKQTQLKSRIKI